MSIINALAIPSIDVLALSSVYGGQQTTLGGQVKTPGVEVNGNYSQQGTPERRNDFLTCMNDRQAQCGWAQSAQSCQAMALEACQGLPGSPRNPLRLPSDQQQPPLQPGTSGTTKQ